MNEYDNLSENPPLRGGVAEYLKRFCNDDFQPFYNLIRNAFSHNSYPEKVVIKGIELPRVAKSYEEMMDNLAHLPE